MDFDQYNKELFESLKNQLGKEVIEHTLFDTRLLTQVKAGETCRFFEKPAGVEQDGKIKTKTVTNLEFAYRLPKQVVFLVTRIAIVAEAIPLCSVLFHVGCKDYENGHIERFHKKIGFEGCDLKLWRQLPPLVNFWIELEFDRSTKANSVYEIRAELQGFLIRGVS